MPSQSLWMLVSLQSQKASNVANTGLKHDGLLEDSTLMRIELVYTNWLSIQAKDVIEKSVPVSPISVME